MAFDTVLSGRFQPDKLAHAKVRKGSNRVAALLRWGIGLFWILAGILQFQPLMFTPDFYEWYPPSIMESTIQSTADGQPHLVVTLVHFGSSVWATHPILFNVLAATLQLCIGLAIIFGPSQIIRMGLWVSVIWGALVWLMGEAFGGVFGGSSYFDGFPGAALLYVISAFLLLAFAFRENSFLALRTSLRYLVTAYWFVVAFLQVIPSSGFWDPSTLMAPFANEAAQPGPAFLARPVEWFALFTQSNTGAINAVMILLMVIMAFLTLLDLWNKATITIAAAWLLWSWWFGQGFGAIFTGSGTDPNSIPVIALWMLCLWGVRFRGRPGGHHSGV